MLIEAISKARVIVALLIIQSMSWVLLAPAQGVAQEKQPPKAEEKKGDKKPATASKEKPLEPPVKVDVQPVARDDEIRDRLVKILKATDWYAEPAVTVKDGVVFLRGQTGNDEYKKWAGDLARNTQDVVAVVNQIDVAEPPIWDFQPALDSLRELWRGLVGALPFILFGLLILILAWIAALGTTRLARVLFRRPITNGLLREVMSRAAGVAIFLLGLYIILQVVGLTRLALTVIGGTGLFGLVIGIAFRDITENFLASIFLSMQNPFRAGDLVEINGILGYVQRVTVRTTIVMTLDGHYVQIPNATVYKSNIRNYSSNPNRREDFLVGIGYADQIPTAQEVALKVLSDHPAVLNDPEPWVLVDSLGKSTVNLRVYFWINGKEHSWLKVKSAVIRLVKRAFQETGISMPDEAREIVFPSAVPIQMLEAGVSQPKPELPKSLPSPEIVPEPAPPSTDAEGGLQSDAEEIKKQVRQSRTPEAGENLLKAHD